MVFLRATLIALGMVVVLALGLASLEVTGPKAVLIEIAPANLVAWLYLGRESDRRHDAADS